MTDDHILERIDALEAAVRELQARVFPAKPPLPPPCFICDGEGYTLLVRNDGFTVKVPCPHCEPPPRS